MEAERNVKITWKEKHGFQHRTINVPFAIMSTANMSIDRERDREGESEREWEATRKKKQIEMQKSL